MGQENGSQSVYVRGHQTAIPKPPSPTASNAAPCFSVSGATSMTCPGSGPSTTGPSTRRVVLGFAGGKWKTTEEPSKPTSHPTQDLCSGLIRLLISSLISGPSALCFFSASTGNDFVGVPFRRSQLFRRNWCPGLGAWAPRWLAPAQAARHPGLPAGGWSDHFFP